MSRLLALRPILALGVGLLAACAAETSVTTEGGFDPGSTTIMSSATTTTTLQETTTTDTPEETTASVPPPVSFEDMAGTYQAKDPGGERFLEILDDGTLHWAPNGNSPQIVLSARFEGTSVLITDPDCGDDVEGVYEFDLLGTGDLAVVLIEDGCLGRAANIPGDYTLSE